MKLSSLNYDRNLKPAMFNWIVSVVIYSTFIVKHCIVNKMTALIDFNATFIMLTCRRSFAKSELFPHDVNEK